MGIVSRKIHKFNILNHGGTQKVNFKFFQFFSAQNANFLFEFSTEFSTPRAPGQSRQRPQRRCRHLMTRPVRARPEINDEVSLEINQSHSSELSRRKSR